ncbi:MAG: hypothetical protein WCO53_09970 [Deltaproteobacteria bacterium]
MVADRRRNAGACRCAVIIGAHICISGGVTIGLGVSFCQRGNFEVDFTARSI